MITFKGGWGKLYYTQHYLKQCGNTNIHTYTHKGEGKGFNIGTPQLHSKAMITFKGGWDKLYYTQHYLKQCGNTNIHMHTHKGEGGGF